MDMSRIVDGIRSRARGARRRDRIAFVLSGGGVLGAVQVGQLDALIEAGVTPDLVVGTSVGALNGAAIAARPNREGIECLRDVWLELATEDIFPGNALRRAMHLVRKGDHLYANDGLRGLIAHLPVHSFEQLVAPLSVCAADLDTGREHWFEDGPLTAAILASAAIPGVFPPVKIDGHSYVDGGVVNNVPISRAVERGATTIYVLTCGVEQPSGRMIRRPLDVLLQSFAHSRAARINLDRERFAAKATIVEMPTFDPGPIAYNDTSHTQRLYETARSASRAFLAEHAAKPA